MHAEKYEAHLVFEGFKFTTKYDARSCLPIYNSFNGISKLKAYNLEFYQDSGKTDNLTLAQQYLLKYHRGIGHMNFRSIIRFECLGLIPFILITIREEDILKCSECCFGQNVVHILIRIGQERLF